jgi:hypothetical protein
MKNFGFMRCDWISMQLIYFFLCRLEESEVEDEHEDDTYKIRFDYVITPEEIQQWETSKRGINTLISPNVKTLSYEK